MSLSSNLKNSNEPACLRATGCGVEYIDKLRPGQINCIKLCLSYNSISSLENITQFKRLNVLLIQYNLISTFEALMPLRELRYLRTLRLEGNPVCNLALFDIHVVYMLPNLQLLNGKRTKEIIEQKDLRYVDYESELIDQISSINFVYEVFKYVLDIYNRDSITTPIENKSVSRINSSSNTPTRSSRSNVIKSSSPASVSSRLNKSVSSKPTNNSIFDLIKEAMKIKRVEILDNKAYKSELTQSLRKNKFTDEGYISFLRLEVLRLDKLIEESVISIIRFTQPPGSPRKDSAFSTPIKSPQHSNKDSNKQLGNENNSTLTDELDMYRFVLSNLKGEEDFDEFVAQQEDLQASSFRIMGIIGGMELEKIGADSSIRSNTTPLATPKKTSKQLSNRNKKSVSDDNDEEEIEENFNMAMTPSAEVREEKAGFVHNQHPRRAKTPAVSKKKNANGIENSPNQKNQAPITPIASSPTSNPTPSKSTLSNKADDFDTPHKDKKAKVSKDFKKNDEQNQINQNNNETNESKHDQPFEFEDDEDILKSESDDENNKHLFEIDGDNGTQKSYNKQNNKEDEIQYLEEEEEEIENEEEKEDKRQLELQKQKEEEEERKKQEQEKQQQLQKQKEEEEERQKQLEQQKQQQEQERKRQLQKQKKEQERQKQLELQKQKEEQEKQRQLELQKQKEEQEKQRQLELQKQKEEQEKQRQLELQRQKEEEEKQKQLELQKQKEEEEKQKQLELQRQQEEERQRKLEQQRQQQEKEKRRQLKKQKQEQEKQRQLELQKQKEEEEKKKQLELQKQKEEEERQKQLELQKQKEEEEKQRQLELQKQKEEKQKQLELQKQKEEEKRRQLELQKQKEEEEKQRQLEQQKQKQEQERKRQLQKQKQEQERQKQLELQKQKEEQEKQKQLELQKQKEEEEKQRQLELQKQKEEQEKQRQLELQKQKEEEKQRLQEAEKQRKLEQEKQNQLLKQKQQEEAEKQKKLEQQQNQKYQLKNDQSPQKRLNISDGDIDKDIQEIVNKTSCDTLLINKISSDEEENENVNFENEEQVKDEEEEKVEPIVPIDMKQQIINFDEEIFSSGNSENEEEDIHNNKVQAAKRNKKIGYDENENNVNTIEEDVKKKEKENSILNRSKDKLNNQRSSSRHESESGSVQQQIQSESEKSTKNNINFDFEEEEEQLVSDVETNKQNQISTPDSQIIQEEEEEEDENYEEVEQSKEDVVYPSQEESKSKVSPHSKDKTNRRSNDDQNEQNSYSPSSSAGNFVFQEPLLSTGEKEEEEEEEKNEKSEKNASKRKKCSIVVTPTAIQVPKDARGSSSECAEYLDSGPDDEEESNNQSDRNRSDSKHQKHKNKSSSHLHHHHQKQSFGEEEEESNQKRNLKKAVSDQDGLIQDFENLEDHESNDLANYVDNTATLSLDEKMQASVDDNEEEENYEEKRGFGPTNSTTMSSFEKIKPEIQNGQEADNVFDYSLEEIENANDNNKSISDNKKGKGKMDEEYNFRFANASSDMRLGAFASSEKLNNSEEIVDNYPNKVKPSITAPSSSQEFEDDSKFGNLNEEDISEDSDSFQRKIMSCIPQSIQNLTKQQEKTTKTTTKKPKNSILLDIEQVPSSSKGSNDERKESEDVGNDIKIEIDADNIANIEIDEMVYDGSRGESMSSSIDKLKNAQKQKQSKSRPENRNKVQQAQLNDFTDGSRFDAESGGGFATPFQSPEYGTSSFYNQYDHDQDQQHQQKSNRQKQQQQHPLDSSSSRLLKRNNHNINNNSDNENDDYNSYADESRDFHENDNFNDNDGSYSNYKRIGGSKTDLAYFGSNAFDASNGGIDMTNAESNEPHWLNSCDDTKFDASYGGAYDSTQPHRKNQQKKKKGDNKQGIVFKNPNNDNEIDFVSRDQSIETDFQHQVRFTNANSHRQQQQQYEKEDQNQKQFAAFSDSNSDLLNDDDDDDEASSSRAATSNAFSSSLYPIMKNSNSILSMTQDNASSSRAEPDSDFHFKAADENKQQQQRRKQRMQVLPISQLFVSKYFNTWKSKSNLLAAKRQKQQNRGQLESTSTSAVINESYIQPRSFQYQFYRANIASAVNGYDNNSLKHMSERRELLRRIEMQKEINNALEARLNQISKEREASENYSISFGYPPSSPLSSSVNRERMRHQQLQQQQLLQQQKNKKERKQDLFTQYRNHVMSSGINKEYLEYE